MVTFVIKPTNACNARCSYCYEMSNTGHRAVMDAETLESIFIRLNEYLAENTSESIDLLWHGGEPLLAGKKYFRLAIEFQNKHCSKTRDRIHHTIQSNLTLLDDEFADILHTLGVSDIGTSYEPEPNVRGLGTSNDSQRYNALFHKALQTLQDKEIQWGIIYVVNSKSLQNPEKVFHYLTNLLEGRPLSITPVLRYRRQGNDYCITPQQYTDFLGRTFRVWWKRGKRKENVQPFKSLYNALVEKDEMDNCMEFGVCASSNELFEISPTGLTQQGGVFFYNNSHIKHRPQYGDIGSARISDLINNEHKREFEKTVARARRDGCHTCELRRYCRQGLRRNGRALPSMIVESEWCQSRRGFIRDHFLPQTGVSLG